MIKHQHNYASLLSCKPAKAKPTAGVLILRLILAAKCLSESWFRLWQFHLDGMFHPCATILALSLSQRAEMSFRSWPTLGKLAVCLFHALACLLKVMLSIG